MKPTLSYALLAALAAVSPALAVDATTTPVGYVTLDVPANADSTITPPLTRPALHSAASSSISGNNVGASGLTASAFVTTASYLKVTSGPLTGAMFPITANTTSSITVDAGSSTLQDLGFVSGNTFKVIPYWTLATLFPAGAGIGGTSDALNPTSFLLESDYSGTGPNRASGKVYFYCTGDTELGLDAGWYDNADPFAGTVDNTPIDPTIQYTIRASSASSVVVSGEVPATQLSTEVVVATTVNDNYLAAPYPVDITLQQSGLQGSIAATSDALNPTEFVFVYDDLAAGFNKSASSAYFYCSGDTELGLDPGWYDNADPFAGVVTSPVLKAGRCFILRKAPAVSAGTVGWTSPIPYTL